MRSSVHIVAHNPDLRTTLPAGAMPTCLALGASGEDMRGALPTAFADRTFVIRPCLEDPADRGYIATHDNHTDSALGGESVPTDEGCERI